MMIKVVSLFCGCGGADLGLLGGFTFLGKKYSKLPFEIVYAADINEKAIATYKENFDAGFVENADIRNTLSKDIPDADLLIGGFPCQSFSTVNPTKNPFDERGQLYKEMVRILREKKPKAFIAENVKGLLVLHEGKIIKEVLKDFEDSGYNVTFQLINAADYGIPQKRQRVIIVGLRNDLGKKFAFPEKTHSGNWVPLSSVIDDLDLEDKKYFFSKKAVEGMKNAKNNMKRGLSQDLNSPSLTITSHLAKVSLNSRDPVLLVDPSRELYRRFTPREAARIQSFPDSFVFVGNEKDAYVQIGNAVPPLLFWHIGKRLADYLITKNKEGIN